MFYRIGEGLEEIEAAGISGNCLTVGIITSEELREIGPSLGFDADTIEASQRANEHFRTGVDVRETFTYAELRLIDSSGNDDYASFFLKKNLLLVVDILDLDQSTQTSFRNSLLRRSCGKVSLEKLVCYFVEDLLLEGNALMETLEEELSKLEDTITIGTSEKDLNEQLLQIKKKVRKYNSFYAQMQDVFDTLDDNLNGIFEESRLMYISNMQSKIRRSREDMHALSDFADHLQAAYTSMMDQRLNNTMKRITVLTTIFFPLTIIVGWYGMNFSNMPELRWEYGYLCVIILSAVVITALLIIGKKRDWF